VTVCVLEAVEVAVGDGEAVGEGVRVPLREGVGVGVGVPLREGVGEGVRVPVREGVGVRELLGVAVGEGVPLPDRVPLCVALGEALPRQAREELDPLAPAVDVPGGQGLQAEAPVAFVQVLGGQGGQARARVALEKLPGGHRGRGCAGELRSKPVGHAAPMGQPTQVKPHDRFP
jgi:hypothetical protein